MQQLTVPGSSSSNMVLVDLEIGGRVFWFVAAATATCTATRVPRPSDVALVCPSQPQS